VNSVAGYLVEGSFRPETVNAFEIGSKNRFLDNTMQLNASTFYYDYKNMQFLNEDPLLYYKGISNVPSAHIYGIEFEFNWLLGRNWSLDANLALERGRIDSHYYALDPVAASAAQVAAGYTTTALYYANYAAATAARASAESDLYGNDVPKIPDVQGSVSLTNYHDFARGTLTSRLEFVHRGSYQSRVFNNAAYDTVPAYNLWNLYFDYKPVDSRWGYSLSVTNLTDKVVINSRVTDPYGSFQTYETYMPPRQLILSASYQF
jgi:iron complex outermembrane receptor protein